MFWKRSSVEHIKPYDLLAKIYDHVMRHVDYVEWADYAEQVFTHFGPVPRHIVEVACGTGTLAVKLAQRGYSVHGIDASEAMIVQARAKAAAIGNGAPTFSVGDMRDLPPDDADAVLCLYDSVNYCLTEDDLRSALSSFRRTVHAEALCLFDVTTEANSLRYFRSYRCREKHEGFVCKRHSRYLQEERLQLNEFVIEQPGSPEAVRELHEQRIYALTDVLAAVSPQEWIVLGAFSDYTLDPADEDAERIHIVLRARVT